MIALPPNRWSHGRPTPVRVWPRLAVALACLCALGAPLTAGADSQAETLLSPGLLEAARAQPDSVFEVIVEGAPPGTAAERTFETVPAVAATLTGSEIVDLAEGSDPLVITRDTPVAVAGEPTETTPPPSPSDELTVTGHPEPGVSLTATPGASSYRWQRCGDGEAETQTDSRVDHWSLGAGCMDIAGADGPSYSPTADDLGLRLRVVADGTASALTPRVTARAPVATSPPSILGTPEEKQTLSAANGSWEGTPSYEFEHQWQRCDADGESCIDIGGATESSYTLRHSDVGTRIRLAVAARGVWGAGFAVAEPTAVVASIPEPLPRFKQHWPYVAGVPSLLSSLQGRELETPTIAIVDSGIDPDRADFGGRVVERVTFNSSDESQAADGNGHGTAVASVAAGEAEGYTGAAPDAKLVDVDVLNDDGMANVSDVIAAADWIYENRERLNIRVANFSLHGTTLASLVSDPLDKAVERLWLSGIVVVAAAGNYAVDGEESAVPFAPGNDPFVLTVGATDTRGSFSLRDDRAAPWSAWGYTRDGFAKPELAAPGRYIAAGVPARSKLARDKPDRIVAPGYMQLSGTSLAAPIVAGTAANLLAAHPEWTPDEVKGALMLSAEPLAHTPARSAGVGAVNAGRAVAVDDPPNPNLALNDFLAPDPAGGPTPVFDSGSWTSAVQADPAWASVAWGSVAWGSAAWSSVAWGSVAWGSVAWGSVAWGSVAWGSVAWGSVAWGSGAEDDVRPQGGYWTRRD